MPSAGALRKSDVCSFEVVEVLTGFTSNDARFFSDLLHGTLPFVNGYIRVCYARRIQVRGRVGVGVPAKAELSRSARTLDWWGMSDL